MTTVFFDVDTQLDFLLPAGALYVPGSEKLIPRFSRLAQFAASHSLPLISTVDAHTENDPEFGSWKPHCVVGTVGQQKPASTLLPQALTVPPAPVEPATLHANVKLSAQLLIEKQNLDCFSNPNLVGILQQLAADRYVVYGVVTEICVQRAVFGLLRLGSTPVEVVVDATASLLPATADEFFRDLQARGGKLTSVAEVIG